MKDLPQMGLLKGSYALTQEEGFWNEADQRAVPDVQGERNIAVYNPVFCGQNRGKRTHHNLKTHLVARDEWWVRELRKSLQQLWHLPKK